MKTINRIILKNFKRFDSFDVKLNEELNIFIGDNESGKSTILEALDIVLSGSRSKVESLGLSNLINKSVIEDFFSEGKSYNKIPRLEIEVFIDDSGNPELNGDNNSLGINSDGLCLICMPSDEYSSDIRSVLQQEGENFPFEFYSIQFNTFSGRSYSSFNRYFNHLFIDNTQINNDYATKKYIQKLYYGKADSGQRSSLENSYRGLKEGFKENSLKVINKGLDYQFSLKSNSKSNLENDLTITEDAIEIENRGKGRQCFIKTDFALSRNESTIDTVLLEEPENHLSQNYTLQLLEKIKNSGNKQIFISTHSNMISSRLGLKQCIMLNSSGKQSTKLSDIDDSSSRFFMKAPDNNVLQFIMSPKVILVEGDAEFILIEAFFGKIAGCTPYESNIHIISVGGKTFKRYLDLARDLDIRVVVITDNDKSYVKNVMNNYEDYENTNWKIFADENDDRYTFEVCMYNDNQSICDELFGGRKKLSVLEYMLQNKAECSFRILEDKIEEIKIPDYIRSAIEWIKD